MNPEQYPPKCIYIIRMQSTDYYKIGVSSDPIHRKRTLQQSFPFLLIHVWHSAYFESRLAYRIENLVHDEYRHYRLSAPHQREWFRLSRADVKKIQETIRAIC